MKALTLTFKWLSAWHVICVIRSLLRVNQTLTSSCWRCSPPPGGWRGTPPRPWTSACCEAEAARGRARGPWGSRRRGRPPTAAARPARQTGDKRRSAGVGACEGARGARGQGPALEEEGAAGAPGSPRGRSPHPTSREESEHRAPRSRPLRRLWRELPRPYTPSRAAINPRKTVSN